MAARAGRFALIDGLRAGAALSVLLSHLISRIYGPGSLPADFAIRLGPAGVSLFFCISGFVLFRPMVARFAAGQQVDVRRFAVRRALRIAPAYWIALTALALYPGLNYVFTDRWWVYYGMLQIYHQPWVIGGLGVAWTLCVELTFYIGLTLLALLAARSSRDPLRTGAFVIVGAAVLSLVWRGEALAHGHGLLATSILGTFAWFAGGMLVALVTAGGRYVRSQRLLAMAQARPLVCWAIAAVIFALLCARATIADEHRNPLATAVEWLGYAVCTTLVFVPALGTGSRVVRGVLGNPVSQWLGMVSYGIYLWHGPIVNVVPTWAFVQGIPLPVAGATVVSVALAVTAAAASWYVIERPAIALSDRLARGWSGRLPVAEGGIGRLALAFPGEEPALDLVAAGPDRVVVEREVAEREDA